MAALQKLLQNQYKSLQRDPVEGFCVEPDESNFLQWKIWMEGPKGSPYEGGVFQLLMTFPETYPMSPPELRFVSEFWHPNVYKDGRVCISILHPPGDDVMSGELPEERWLPTQTVSTIMLSVISMLSDPNINSPANVDASVQWRDNRAKFKEYCKTLVEKANRQKPPHVKIPHPETDPEERKAAIEKRKLLEGTLDLGLDDDLLASEGDEDDLDFDFDPELSDDVIYDNGSSEQNESRSISNDKEPKKKDSKTKKKESAKKKSDSKEEGKKTSHKKTEEKKKDEKGTEEKKNKSSPQTHSSSTSKNETPTTTTASSTPSHKGSEKKSSHKSKNKESKKGSSKTKTSTTSSSGKLTSSKKSEQKENGKSDVLKEESQPSAGVGSSSPSPSLTNERTSEKKSHAGSNKTKKSSEASRSSNRKDKKSSSKTTSRSTPETK